MTTLDCCISLKRLKKILVVLGVVDMRQLLLRRQQIFAIFVSQYSQLKLTQPFRLGANLWRFHFRPIFQNCYLFNLTKMTIPSEILILTFEDQKSKEYFDVVWVGFDKNII